MKKLIFSFALLLAFALPSYSEWKYELIWQRKSYETEFNSQGFQVSKLNPNDSTILTISWDFETVNRFSIFKFNAFTGEIIKYYLNEDSIANLEYSKDGSYLSVSSNNFLGFVDTANLQYTFKINYPGISGRYQYNEDKKVLTGFTSNTIRLFNSQTGQLIKSYDPSYFTPNNLVIQKVALSNVDGKIIYDYTYKIFIGPQPDKYEYYHILRIIDSNGKVIYEANIKSLMNSESPWALSNDGTRLAYYNNNTKIHIFDLVTMKVISEVDAISPSPVNLKFSKDDKILYHSYSEGFLYSLDLFDFKSTLLNRGNSYNSYDFNHNDLNYVYLFYSGGIYKFKTNASTGILEIPLLNMFELVTKPEQNSIEMKLNLISSYILKAYVYDINGKMITQLENKNFEAGIYNQSYNIANLPNGAYYIQIQLNHENYPQVLKFVKGN